MARWSPTLRYRSVPTETHDLLSLARVPQSDKMKVEEESESQKQPLIFCIHLISYLYHNNFLGHMLQNHREKVSLYKWIELHPLANDRTIL